MNEREPTPIATATERDGKIVWARKDGHEAYVVASKLKWRILSDEATL